MRTLFFIVISLTIIISSASAATIEKKTVCTWDPVGNSGPVMAFFKGAKPSAQSWGADLTFIPYEDENQVTQDLRDKKCDIGIVTAILSRDFVPFAGTLDAIGAIKSEQQLKKTMAAISSPKAVDLMSSGEYEVVASMPIGSMFAFVKDRGIKNIHRFRGKTMAILNGDIQTQTFAELAGAIPLRTTLSNFSHQFNSGYLDIVLMPALAYTTFELYKGIGDKGGILDIRLFYGMLQAIALKSSFDDAFGTNMRRWIVNRMRHITTMIDNAEKEIPKKHWIKTDQETKDELEEFYKNIRLTLKVNDKFDTRSLSLLWKIRCFIAPNRDECELPTQ